MPVHSLILSTTEGNPLFSKYYDRDTLRTPDGSLIFEQHLRNHTSFNWRKAAFSKQTVTISNVHVVYKQFDEILIFASGTSDVDESVLSDVLDALEKVLLDLLDGKILENSFLNPDLYGKFVICVDEIVPQGIIDNLDAESVVKLSKMKNLN